MIKMRKIFPLLGIGVLALAASNANAEDLNLVCYRDLPSGLMDIKTVLIGDDNEVTTMKKSSKDETIVNLKRFAVVITLIPGEGPDGIAQEEFEVLSSRQFRLTELTTSEGHDRQWSFRDLKNKKRFECSVNGEARANPALTRNN